MTPLIYPLEFANIVLKHDLEQFSFYPLYNHNHSDRFRLLTSNEEMTFACHLLQINNNEQVYAYVCVTICFVF